MKDSNISYKSYRFELLEAKTCPDCMHMLIEMPPKYAILEFMGS